MINFQLLQDSVTYYENLDYTRIETPWVVSKAAESVTKPDEGTSLIITPYKFDLTEYKEISRDSWGCLVASGEQSYLELYLNGNLPKGKFQTITPCFRDEIVDYTHSKWFMKNELIITDKVDDKELNIMVDEALAFFKQYIPDAYVMSDIHGYDIIGGGIELGSYGIRECEFVKWIYGTGCAEPRLSKAIKYYEATRAIKC